MRREVCNRRNGMQIKGETREGRKQMTPISKHSEDQNMTKDIRLEGNQKQKNKERNKPKAVRR